jgi:hypothetical protein
MSDLAYALMFTAIGAFFLVHCSRATLKEFKSGRALAGEFGDYDRETSPVGFWVVVTANAAAALIGAGFLFAGIVGLLGYAGLIR